MGNHSAVLQGWGWQLAGDMGCKTGLQPRIPLLLAPFFSKFLEISSCPPQIQQKEVGVAVFTEPRSPLGRNAAISYSKMIAKGSSFSLRC